MDTYNIKSLSAKVNFSEISKRLDKIRSAKTQKEKTDIFERFIAAIKELQINFLKDSGGSNTDASLLPFLRLIIPKLDTERDSYGIRTKTLGRLYVKALAINEISNDGKKLLLHDGLKSGDYGDVVFDVMKRRSPESGTLKVFDINKYLDLIGDHFRNNERAKTNDEISVMLKRMTATDRKWLTRIILKKMGLGLGQQKMLQIYHPKANDLYNQYSHLSRVCEAIECGKVTNDVSIDQSIELFKPIRPQLCERAQIAHVKSMLQKNAYYLETKMDGERFHIHIRGRTFKYFSRSSNEDFTNDFGGDNQSGLYSPILYELLRQSDWNGKGKIETVVLDGEMMVWSREETSFLKKGDRNTARFLKPNDPILSPCFCVYDILYLNGETLLQYPYAERISKLKSMIVEREGSLMLCERVKVANEIHFLELLNKHIDAREEGVVIKRADAKYQPGKRERSGWFKIKPDYENNLISDFDLIIIGAKYKDVNRNRFDSFYLGVFNRNERNTDAGVFYAVCSVRNGFRHADFTSICEQLRPYWNKTSISDHRCINGSVQIEWNRVRPDVWINPTKSIVLQVKASQVVPTSTFRTSHTLLFPRVMEIRRDKPWHDVCSFEEFSKFCSPMGKITKRAATEYDLFDEPLLKIGKRRKTTLPAISSTTIAAKPEKVDEICQGKEFCVLNAPKFTHTTKDLEAVIIKHGGIIVENPGPRTFVCIADHDSFRVKTLIKKGDYDIVKAEWLFRTLGSNDPLTVFPKFNRRDMFYVTLETLKQIQNNFDNFDDSYTEPFKNTEELLAFFDTMDEDKLPIYLRSEFNEIEAMLGKGMDMLSMFRLLTAYFYQSESDKDKASIELAKFIFQANGGISLNSKDDIQTCPARITHVFVDSTSFDRDNFKETMQFLDIDLHNIRIIDCQWIHECHLLNKKICDKFYTIELN